MPYQAIAPVLTALVAYAIGHYFGRASQAPGPVTRKALRGVIDMDAPAVVRNGKIIRPVTFGLQ